MDPETYPRDAKTAYNIDPRELFKVFNEIENQQLAGKLKKNPELRLACQVKVLDNMTVETHVWLNNPFQEPKLPFSRQPCVVIILQWV